MSCPFCEIDRNRILKEMSGVFAVLSNPRLMPGHTLVMPKRHVQKISELAEAERKEIFDLVVEMEDKILKEVATGCDVSQHFRPFIEQSKIKVDHLHFHLRPRSFEDELYQKSQRHEKDVFKDLSEEEFEKFKKLLGG